MTWGFEVESRMNLTCKLGSEPRTFRIRACRGRQSAVLRHHKLWSLCLVCSKARTADEKMLQISTDLVTGWC